MKEDKEECMRRDDNANISAPKLFSTSANYPVSNMCKSNSNYSVNANADANPNSNRDIDSGEALMYDGAGATAECEKSPAPLYPPGGHSAEHAKHITDGNSDNIGNNSIQHEYCNPHLYMSMEVTNMQDTSTPVPPPPPSGHVDESCEGKYTGEGNRNEGQVDSWSVPMYKNESSSMCYKNVSEKDEEDIHKGGKHLEGNSESLHMDGSDQTKVKVKTDERHAQGEEHHSPDGYVENRSSISADCSRVSDDSDMLVKSMEHAENKALLMENKNMLLENKALLVENVCEEIKNISDKINNVSTHKKKKNVTFTNENDVFNIPLRDETESPGGYYQSGRFRVGLNEANSANSEHAQGTDSSNSSNYYGSSGSELGSADAEGGGGDLIISPPPHKGSGHGSDKAMYNCITLKKSNNAYHMNNVHNNYIEYDINNNENYFSSEANNKENLLREGFGNDTFYHGRYDGEEFSTMAQGNTEKRGYYEFAIGNNSGNEVGIEDVGVKGKGETHGGAGECSNIPIQDVHGSSNGKNPLAPSKATINYGSEYRKTVERKKKGNSSKKNALLKSEGKQKRAIVSMSSFTNKDHIHGRSNMVEDKPNVLFPNEYTRNVSNIGSIGGVSSVGGVGNVGSVGRVGNSTNVSSESSDGSNQFDGSSSLNFERNFILKYLSGINEMYELKERNRKYEERIENIRNKIRKRRTGKNINKDANNLNNYYNILELLYNSSRKKMSLKDKRVRALLYIFKYIKNIERKKKKKKRLYLFDATMLKRLNKQVDLYIDYVEKREYKKDLHSILRKGGERGDRASANKLGNSLDLDSHGNQQERKRQEGELFDRCEYHKKNFSYLRTKYIQGILRKKSNLYSTSSEKSQVRKNSFYFHHALKQVNYLNNLLVYIRFIVLKYISIFSVDEWNVLLFRDVEQYNRRWEKHPQEHPMQRSYAWQAEMWDCLPQENEGKSHLKGENMKDGSLGNKIFAGEGGMLAEEVEEVGEQRKNPLPVTDAEMQIESSGESRVVEVERLNPRWLDKAKEIDINYYEYVIEPFDFLFYDQVYNEISSYMQMLKSGDPPNGNPPNGNPPNGNPPNGNPPNGNPPNGNPPNGDPPNGNPPNGDPPNGDPPNGNPPNGDPPNGNPPNGDPPNGDPPNGNPPNGNPPNGDLPNGGASRCEEASYEPNVVKGLPVQYCEYIEILTKEILNVRDLIYRNRYIRYIFYYIYKNGDKNLTDSMNKIFSTETKKMSLYKMQMKLRYNIFISRFFENNNVFFNSMGGEGKGGGELEEGGLNLIEAKSKLFTSLFGKFSSYHSVYTTKGEQRREARRKLFNIKEERFADVEKKLSLYAEYFENVKNSCARSELENEGKKGVAEKEVTFKGFAGDDTFAADVSTEMMNEHDREKLTFDVAYGYVRFLYERNYAIIIRGEKNNSRKLKAAYIVNKSLKDKENLVVITSVLNITKWKSLFSKIKDVTIYKSEENIVENVMENSASSGNGGNGGNGGDGGNSGDGCYGCYGCYGG
ncbi:hypothetical protein POVCU1_073890, partial [Plasmodium ovale curtisi]